MTDRTKEQLTELIENLYSQWQNEKPSELKEFVAEQIRKYAIQYKEVTGNWYIREATIGGVKCQDQ